MWVNLLCRLTPETEIFVCRILTDPGLTLVRLGHAGTWWVVRLRLGDSWFPFPAGLPFQASERLSLNLLLADA